MLAVAPCTTVSRADWHPAQQFRQLVLDALRWTVTPPKPVRSHSRCASSESALTLSARSEMVEVIASVTIAASVGLTFE